MTERERKALEAAKRLRDQMSPESVGIAKCNAMLLDGSRRAWIFADPLMADFADALDELEREEADAEAD